MQEVKLRVDEFYGDHILPLSFPDGWKLKIVEMNGSNLPPMTDEEIQNSLDNTIGGSNIIEQARGKKGKIVITCDDLSRPTPAHSVFPFIIDNLHKAGISDKQIFILSSFGTHPPMSLDNFSRKVGESAVAKYDCVNHNPFDNFENLGKTSRGTPLLINKEFISADLRICISGVKKHDGARTGSAGASGGGKAVLPGVSSIETIAYNHNVLAERRPEDKKIGAYWWIKNNEERSDMQEAARIADLNISVNCVFNGNRQLIGIYAGDLDDAWKESVKFCYQAHATNPIGKGDIVILNSYPQGGRGIEWWGAEESLEKQGTIVAIHQYTPGISIQHYLGEKARVIDRIRGYINRRWPVEQANEIIFFTKKLSRRHILKYTDKVKWMTSWNSVLPKLIELHDEDSTAIIYTCPPLQFNKKKYPLLL